MSLRCRLSFGTNPQRYERTSCVEMMTLMSGHTLRVVTSIVMNAIERAKQSRRSGEGQTGRCITPLPDSLPPRDWLDVGCTLGLMRPRDGCEPGGLRHGMYVSIGSLAGLDIAVNGLVQRTLDRDFSHCCCDAVRLAASAFCHVPIPHPPCCGQPRSTTIPIL